MRWRHTDVSHLRSVAVGVQSQRCTDQASPGTQVDKNAWIRDPVWGFKGISQEILSLAGQTAATVNHHSSRLCLVKPTQWFRLTQFISLLCVTSPRRHGSCRGARTKTGVFHQDLRVKITHCVYMCEVSFIVQQHVWWGCFYTAMKLLGFFFFSPLPLQCLYELYVAMSYSKKGHTFSLKHLCISGCLSSLSVIHRITITDAFLKRLFQSKGP